MARSAFITALSVCFVAGCSPAKPSSSSDEKDWSETFLTDLEAARSIIAENHPGAIDPDNPAFNDWLNDGYAKAQKLAPQIKNGRDYRYALASYDAGFRDGHLVIAPDMKNGVRVGFEREKQIQRWPGFLTEWRDSVHLIAHTSYALQHLDGGTVKTCDGRSAKQITADKVFDFGRNPELPAHWVNAVKYTFIDTGNSLVPLPNVCEIKLPDNTVKSQELRWRDYDYEELGDALNEIGFGRSGSPGTQWLDDEVLWITIPHFQPNGEAVDVYKSMQMEITDNRDKIAAVVFDLRGNGGGSSFWGNGFASALWGDDTVKALQNSFPSGYVEWRATPHNLEKMTKWLANEIENNGKETEGAQWARNVIDGMQTALKQNFAMWRESEPGDTAPLNTELIGKLNQGPKAYVLTDGFCASACLDFMDLMTASPATVHIGYETSADTQYMDITAKKLPSGLMSVIYPVKVYRGRRRPDGGYYTPEYKYDGPWTTEDVQRWAVEIMSADK